MHDVIQVALESVHNAMITISLQVGHGRVIQSVGTPYSGTPVAGGLIPKVGGILGLGCGIISDLTVEGALRWQRDIPPTKQKEVFFYTTQVSFQQNLNGM